MSFDSTQLESYVPVYDVVPEEWNDARPFLVETLKKITNAVNIRTIGWLLDEELLSGQSFVPGATVAGNNPAQNRQVLRMVINCAPLAAGANAVPHSIQVDSKFTLVDMWVAVTNSAAPEARVITGNNVSITPGILGIISPGAYDRAWAVVEYMQEV